MKKKVKVDELNGLEIKEKEKNPFLFISPFSCNNFLQLYICIFHLTQV